MFVDRIALDGGFDRLEEYVADLPAVRSLAASGGMEFTSPVTFFTGENGTGKSTVIEAIAVAVGFNAEGGSRNFSFATRSTESGLHQYMSVERRDYPKDGYFLRAESLYNLASNIEELDRQPAAAPPVIDGYGGRSLHEQSHGESFMSLVANRFRGSGLYILDEPEAALSPTRQMLLLRQFDRLVKSGSQLIIATHSPILMAFPNAEIYEFSADGIDRRSYDRTENYNIYRRFLSDPERAVTHLLK